MASNYWLKLYHEMLDDPKVMTLRPALRWRFVETLLVAGELDQEGALPDTAHYAWRVRASEEVVETELAELADAGLLSRDGGKWFVTKFAERQAADSAAERMRRMRERQRKQEYYQEETEEKRDSDEAVTNRNTDKIREDKDTDNNAGGGAGAAFTAYENEIGRLTPLISEKLGSRIDELSEQWVIDAIGIAVTNGVRKMSYIEAILDRWASEGRADKREPQNERAELAFQKLQEAIKRNQFRDLPEDIRATVGRTRRSTQDLRAMPPEKMPFYRREFLEAYHAAI